MAALSRIARKEHRQIKIRSGDTVVFSANPIPGNTIAVVNTIDQLMMQGANVIYGRHHGIHVSGHGSQEDQKLMISLTRPKFFLPVHGEHRMLIKHAQTAQAMGISSENMVIINNGDIVELTPSAIGIGGQVPSGIELMDRSGILKAHVLEERQRLAEGGMVTVAATIGLEGKLLSQPEVHLRGVVTNAALNKWRTWVAETIDLALRNRWEQFAQPDTTPLAEVDWDGLKSYIQRELEGMLRRELKTKASLLFLLQHPQGLVKTSCDRAVERSATPVAS